MQCHLNTPQLAYIRSTLVKVILIRLSILYTASLKLLSRDIFIVYTFTRLVYANLAFLVTRDLSTT